LKHYKRVLGIFSPRMRRNGYLGTFNQKSVLAIRFSDTYFLQQVYNSFVGLYFRYVLAIF